MALDRSKVLETAQKYLGKGQYDRAIAEYRKLVDADPNDVRTWLKIGDLHTRQGARREACQTYGLVADHYTKQGFFRKAVAVYKQILKLDSTRLDVLLALAQTYEHLQLTSDALMTYETVTNAYARQGDLDRALETLSRMAGLDPENIPVRIKYAEALSKAGRTSEAADAFAIGARLLKELGRVDDFIKVAERLLYHRPEDAGLARELAELYLDREDPKRALSKLQLCFKADPRDVPTLHLLARAFQVLGQLAKTISVLKEIARIHLTTDRHAERQAVLEKIFELDPSDHEARAALEAYAPPPPEEPATAIGDDDDDPEFELIDGDDDALVLEDDADVLLVDGESDATAFPAPPAAPREAQVYAHEEPSVDVVVEEVPTNVVQGVSVQAIERGYESEAAPPAAEGGSEFPSVPPDIAREAQIARLLTECDVFQRYGLRSKVVEQLQRVLDIAPEHVEARERLKDAFIEGGRFDDALAELYTLAELFEPDRPQLAHLYYQQVLELAPEHEPARSRVEARRSVRPPGAQAQPAVGDPTDDSVVFVDEGEEDLVTDESVTYDEDPGDADEVRVDALSAPTRNVAFDDESPTDDVPVPDLSAQAPEGAEAHAVDHRAAREQAAREQAALEQADERAAPELQAAAARPAGGGDAPAGQPPAPSYIPPPPPASTGNLRPRVPEAVPAPRGLAPMSPEEFEAAPLDRRSDSRAEALERASLPPGEIEEILDEVEFFIAQGLLDEARATLEETLSNHPDHPIVLDKLTELNQLETTGADEVAAPPATPEEDDAFLLAERLAEELVEHDTGDEVVDALDVESVFAQFKKGVEEQISADDSDTHFDLGIAYKEMGLLDDAIQEFHLARSNPERECISFTMMGLCAAEKGDLPSSIEYFKKGLYCQSKTEREELGLHYELGMAYELLRDPREALYFFEKVHKREPGFRHVDQKIEALRALAAPPPPPPAALGAEDVDRAFDDLMGED